MAQTLLFLDLDDTLFQTLRKNPQGSIQATQTTSTPSYMTQAQQIFWQLFYHNPAVNIIPVTARDQRQYNNSFLSKDSKITTAVLYFSGVILEQGKIDEVWQENRRNAYAKLAVSIADSQAQVQTALASYPLNYFNLYNVENYYLTIKASADCPLALRAEVFQHLKTLLPPHYLLHENDRALSLLPEFLDKSRAVRYLIERYQPLLTLGAGDSLTDWGFMQCCDFRLIPARTQLDSALV